MTTTTATTTTTTESTSAATITPGSYNTDVSDMIAVHKAIVTSFDAAPACVTRAGEDPGRVGVIVSFFENVIEMLHVHHTGEDELIYPILEQRCAEGRAALERIDDQHKLLPGPMAAASAALAAWRAAPSRATAQAVIEAMTAINATLRPHLAEEEATVLPLASKWLSREEWGRMAGHGMSIFRGDKPFLMLGLVREQLDQAHRDGMLAGMPPQMRAMWTERGEPAFNGFMAAVRG